MPMPEEQAFARLEFFANINNDPEEREAALNDPKIADGFVLAYLRTMPTRTFEAALGFLSRPLVLHELLIDATTDQRLTIAFNPATAPEDLRRLAEDPSPDVRAQLAFNPNTEPDVLASLLLDGSERVREAVQEAFDTDFGHFLRTGQRWVDGIEEP